MISEFTTFPKINLGEICEIIIGKTPARKNEEYWGKGYSWVSISDMNNKEIIRETKEEITEKAIKETNIKLIPKGTLLFSYKLSIGKTVFTGKPIYTNEAIAALPIVDTEEVFPKYLYYVLSQFNFTSTSDPAAKGITLNKSKLKNLQIPLPPLSTQKKIAAILDKAQALIDNDKKVLEKYDQLAQSVFLDMFGDPVRNEKGWKTNKLSELGNWQSGGTPSKKKEEYFTGNIPWLTARELENIYTYDSIDKITDKAIKESAAKIIEPGSLLLGMYDTAALKSTINKVELSCNQAIAFSKLDEKKADTLFIYYAIQLGKTYFKRMQRGVRQKNMNLSMIRNLEIMNPPLNLQHKFSSIIDKLEYQKNQAQQSLQKSEELFNSLLQKAFKGELVE
jgi:type I restriction enzyme S subunit